MGTRRKKYPPTFKAKVALEVIKEEKRYAPSYREALAVGV